MSSRVNKTSKKSCFGASGADHHADLHGLWRHSPLCDGGLGAGPHAVGTLSLLCVRALRSRQRVVPAGGQWFNESTDHQRIMIN